MKKEEFSVIQRYPAYFSGYQILYGGLSFRRHNKSILLKEREYYTYYRIITISIYDNKILYVASTLSNLLYIV